MVVVVVVVVEVVVVVVVVVLDLDQGRPWYDGSDCMASQDGSDLFDYGVFCLSL